MAKLDAQSYVLARRDSILTSPEGFNIRMNPTKDYVRVELKSYLAKNNLLENSEINGSSININGEKFDIVSNRIDFNGKFIKEEGKETPPNDSRFFPLFDRTEQNPSNNYNYREFVEQNANYIYIYNIR